MDLLKDPARFVVGLPYALGLLAILGVHELGHYFTAKHHDIRVTPPYFIPVPFASGTFGAFIQMRSPVENRRALFDVAVAGPLAGLVVAIPALLSRPAPLARSPGRHSNRITHDGRDVGRLFDPVRGLQSSRWATHCNTAIFSGFIRWPSPDGSGCSSPP